MDELEIPEERRSGYITIKAVHIWAPFLFQLVLLVGGYFKMQQTVEDLLQRLDHMQTEIVELRQHIWK